MTPSWNQLTADERLELEMRFNGPIPEQAVLDKIATRPVRDRAFVEERIKQQLGTITVLRNWLIEDQDSGKDDWTVGTSRNAVIAAERKLDALYAELARLPAEAHSIAAE